MVWQERRLSLRHPIELPIRYRVLDKRKTISPPDSLVLPSQRTKDISDSGLLFLSSQYFEVGTVLELTLPVKDRLFTMEGRVVHANRHSESGLYRTGIYFPSPDSVFKIKMAEQLNQIDQYRKALSKEEGRVVSEEEAAHRWIDERSGDFAEFYK